MPKTPESGPFPLLRDVGKIQMPLLTEKPGRRCICPSPFQRDVGGFCWLDGGMGEGETRGGTQGVGGPSSMSTQ